MRFLPMKPTSNMVCWLSLLWRPSFDLWAGLFILRWVCWSEEKVEGSCPLQKHVRDACWARLWLAQPSALLSVHTEDCSWSLIHTDTQHIIISKLTSYQRLESLSIASLPLIPPESCECVNICINDTKLDILTYISVEENSYFACARASFEGTFPVHAHTPLWSYAGLSCGKMGRACVFPLTSP